MPGTSRPRRRMGAPMHAHRLTALDQLGRPAFHFQGKLLKSSLPARPHSLPSLSQPLPLHSPLSAVPYLCIASRFTASRLCSPSADALDCLGRELPLLLLLHATLIHQRPAHSKRLARRASLLATTTPPSCTSSYPLASSTTTTTTTSPTLPLLCSATCTLGPFRAAAPLLLLLLLLLLPVRPPKRPSTRSPTHCTLLHLAGFKSTLSCGSCNPAISSLPLLMPIV